jgi:hypothetical protein
MQTKINPQYTIVNLDGLRVMGAPAKPNQYQKLAARQAQRAQLELPSIRA